MPKYSIIIPAYNEAARLGATLDRVLAYVSSQAWDAEIIVVNDGSRDHTADLVREYSQKHPELQLLENPGNRGKGYSVRNGMMQARGAILIFSDADLSSPIEEATKLLAALQQGADIAIGS
ncbi:MAG TPA: glycosyltransferase, partial [Terriglobales bacterium]